jgi:hypothetical protein
MEGSLSTEACVGDCCQGVQHCLSAAALLQAHSSTQQIMRQTNWQGKFWQGNSDKLVHHCLCAAVLLRAHPGTQQLMRQTNCQGKFWQGNSDELVHHCLCAAALLRAHPGTQQIMRQQIVKARFGRATVTSWSITAFVLLPSCGQTQAHDK